MTTQNVPGVPNLSAGSLQCPARWSQEALAFWLSSKKPESGLPIWLYADRGSSIAMYCGVAGEKKLPPLTKLAPSTPRHERKKKKKEKKNTQRATFGSWQGVASANDHAVSHPMSKPSYHIALHACKDRPRVEKISSDLRGRATTEDIYLEPSLLRFYYCIQFTVSRGMAGYDIDRDDRTSCAPLPLGYVKRCNFHVLNILGVLEGHSAPIAEKALGVLNFWNKKIPTKCAYMVHTYALQ